MSEHRSGGRGARRVAGGSHLALVARREAHPAELPELAARANTEHAAYEATQSVAVAHAIAAGDALTEAKGQLKHGEWLPWLAEHVRFSERTARRYMSLASNRTRVADLDSVRAAVAKLAEPKATPAEKSDGARLRAKWRKLDALIGRPVGATTVPRMQYARQVEAFEATHAEHPDWAWKRAVKLAEEAADAAALLPALPGHGEIHKGRAGRAKRAPERLQAAAEHIERLLADAKPPDAESDK